MFVVHVNSLLHFFLWRFVKESYCCLILIFIVYTDPLFLIFLFLLVRVLDRMGIPNCQELIFKLLVSTDVVRIKFGLIFWKMGKILKSMAFIKGKYIFGCWARLLNVSEPEQKPRVFGFGELLRSIKHK